MRRVVIFALLVLAIAFLAKAENVQTNGVTVKWIKYLSPTDQQNRAYGTCIFGDYVAVVGDANNRPYVALLNKNDGKLIKEWIGKETGYLYNCISIGDKLYAVGKTFIIYNNLTHSFDVVGTIYVFNKTLNVVSKIINYKNGSVYTSITYDGNYIYVGGKTRKDSNESIEVILLEKRTFNLTLINSKEIEIYPFRGDLWTKDVEFYKKNLRIDIVDIDVNPVTGDLWIIEQYTHKVGTLGMVVLY